MVMKRVWVCLFAGALMASATLGVAQDKDKEKDKKDEKVVRASAVAPEAELPGDSTTEGSVTVGGQAIAYKAVAGTLTVGSTDAQDATLGLDGKMLPGTGEKR